MAQVSFRDAVTYGFNLLGYLVILGLTTGLLSVIGAWFGGTGAGQPYYRIVLGAIFSAASVLVFGAGMMGLTYKVIADAVKRGTRS